MDSIRVSHFYKYQELTQLLNEIAGSMPGLVSIYPIAQTPEGRKVWCAEVTDKKATLPMEERSGFLVTGNIHSIELAGSCACICLLKRLLEGYEKDDEIKKLLGKQVFYIIPRISVDGAEYVLNTLDEVRSKRIDVKERNVVYPEDIDGNGKILFMRWKNPDGGYKISEKDSRLMIPKESSDTRGPFYHLCREGIIHEWDGKTIAGSRAFCDFNRNFPANWVPMPILLGQGRYPLSEPETRGVADFVLDHPNIINAIDFHTGNSAIFIPVAAAKGKAKFLQDEAFFYTLGKRGEEITGFPVLAGYDEISTGLPTTGLPGAFQDWLYQHLGIPCFLIELGDFHNYLGMSTWEYCSYKSVTKREERLGLLLLDWQDQNSQEDLFFQWRAFNHPQLGEVEIGGWNWSLWRNPPLFMMEEVCNKAIDFLFEVSSHVPQVIINEIISQNLGQDLYKISVEVINLGKVATNITYQGMDVNPFSSPQIEIIGPESMEIIIGAKHEKIGHLPAYSGKKRLEWVVRSPKGTISVVVTSNRGVYVKKSLTL